METPFDYISRTPADLPRPALRRMLALVRLLERLAATPAYRELVAPLLPDAARFDPGHAAVMMGYDFHLTDTGPKLIEVNTNAGGGLFAWLAKHADAPLADHPAAVRLRRRLLDSFVREYAPFAPTPGARPRRIAIVDENPPVQFLYAEMQTFAELFRQWGVAAEVADPSELDASGNGVFLRGERVDLVYNRHCDFYLETPELRGLRSAYLSRTVCLTPNPHAYGLLADKRRMILWSDAAMRARLPLARREAELLAQCVPESHLLAETERERVWAERRSWVFKPVDRFGSRGVLLGEKISRTRFDQLPETTTLVQRLAPPSLTRVGDGELKTDFRIYAYRRQALGVAARLYRGQVTNLRTPGGGFAAVRLSK